MTVAEAISVAQELSLETSDTEASQSPRAWLYLLRTSLNEVCQASDGFYYSYEADLAAGVNLYCAPGLYKINAVQVSDGNGQMIGLASATARDLRTWIDPGADPTTSTGTPTRYIWEGADRVILYPTPSYSTTGTPGNPNATPPTGPSGYGLIVEGYAKAGDLWILAPGGTSDLTTVCPVDSENAQMASVFRAMEIRAAQFGKGSFSEWCHAQYVYKKGAYEAEVMNKTFASRRRMTEKVGGSGAVHAGPDPLGRW